MALTGRAGGPAQMCPAPLAACADGVWLALDAVAPGRLPAALAGSDLLGERAALAGLARRGSVSPGGACRILATATTPLAVNLARASDWECVPAWLEDDTPLPADAEGRWEAVAQRLARREPAALIEQGRLLGLAVADAAAGLSPGRAWHDVVAIAHPATAAGSGGTATVSAPIALAAASRAPLVVDLSALWAGPLCGRLLHALGARVVKVESADRPDGARAGEPRFFDLLNAGKESVVLDFGSARGRRQLRELIARADIVIESSRPRALRQLGIVAEEVLAERPAITWLALSGYGRSARCEDWIAYGDDAGIAAGLSSLLHEVTGEWLVCGDAIADPLTGLHAALAAWSSWLDGGGRLLSLALRDVVAHAASFELPRDPAARQARHREWCEVLRACGQEAAPPRARAPSGAAAAMGHHTLRVLGELEIGRRIDQRID